MSTYLFESYGPKQFYNKHVFTETIFWKKILTHCLKCCLLSACGTISLEAARKTLKKKTTRQDDIRPVQPRTKQNMIRSDAIKGTVQPRTKQNRIRPDAIKGTLGQSSLEQNRICSDQMPLKGQSSLEQNRI